MIHLYIKWIYKSWWLALLPHSKKVPGSSAHLSLHVLPMLAWVSSGYSGFFPQSTDMHVRLIGGSKLPVGVLVSVHGCSSMCGPAMDWQPVQDVPLPLAQRELG